LVSTTSSLSPPTEHRQRAMHAFLPMMAEDVGHVDHPAR
jgi:hypothetical protein